MTIFKKNTPPTPEKNRINQTTASVDDSHFSFSGGENSIDLPNCKLKHSTISITGNSNRVAIDTADITNALITINGSNNLFKVGKGTLISNLVIVINGDDHEILFGESIHIYGKLDIWVADDSNRIKIGDYSTFGVVKIGIAMPETEIVLGQDCMIGNDVTIKNSDFHTIIDLETNKSVNPSGNIHIGNHVWLGENCHILKNISINDNSVVALGSIVTQDVPENCVVAGNPAKVVKRNISWSREKI